MTDITRQFSDVFNGYAAEGVAPLSDGGHTPRLSHVCFKFASQGAYDAYVAAARGVGVVTQEIFKGKEITWCRLHQPLKKGSLRLEWLELVEPRFEKHGSDGVANIGYSVAGLPAAVKRLSSDSAMMFRYQAQHADDMAPRP